MNVSLNPSSLIAAQANPGRDKFQNLARPQDCSDSMKKSVDQVVYAELKDAGIKTEGPHEFLRKHNGEVPTAYIGSLCRWGFRRAWYYWIAEGPGIPPDKAQEFHERWGKEVRVDGHCGCPAPLEWFRGFAVGRYHIDTQEGLNAFAELLRSIYTGE